MQSGLTSDLPKNEMNLSCDPPFRMQKAPLESQRGFMVECYVMFFLAHDDLAVVEIDLPGFKMAIG